MRDIEYLVEKYKVEILPIGADDWKEVCKAVAKEYARKILDEIEDNPATYIEDDIKVKCIGDYTLITKIGYDFKEMRKLEAIIESQR